MEFKGILSTSEDYWKNNSNTEDNYNTLNDENNKGKIKYFLEIRNSVTSCESNIMNSTYSYTQTSEYNLNDSIKEENSVQKNADFSNCIKSKLKFYFIIFYKLLKKNRTILSSYYHKITFNPSNNYKHYIIFFFRNNSK